MRRPSGNDLLIATSLSGGEPLMLTKEQRSRHLYVTGSIVLVSLATEVDAAERSY